MFFHCPALILQVGLLLPRCLHDLPDVTFRNGGQLEEPSARSGDVDGFLFGPG